MKRRQDWFEEQLDLDPERLVFIDETYRGFRQPAARIVEHRLML